MGHESMAYPFIYRITGNRKHGYSITVDGLTMSGFSSRQEAIEHMVYLITNSRKGN